MWMLRFKACCVDATVSCASVLSRRQCFLACRSYDLIDLGTQVMSNLYGDLYTINNLVRAQ